MRRYIEKNKATVFSLGFAGVFMGAVTAAALILSEVSPSVLL